MNDPTIEVYPATADTWDDVVTVMGTRGDPSRCWCQFFLLTGAAWRESRAAENRERLRCQITSAGYPVGVLARQGAHPIGWCAVAPIDDYPRLLASPLTGTALPGTWSITCFVVRVGHRRQGVSRALLAGAVDHARAGGARLIEAYPIDTTVRESASSADLYHGPLGIFLDAGFTEVARPSPARPLVRLMLPAEPG